MSALSVRGVHYEELLLIIRSILNAVRLDSETTPVFRLDTERIEIIDLPRQLEFIA